MDSTVDYSSAGQELGYTSIRWAGYVRAPVSDVYTFSVSTTDFVRVYMGDRLVADLWDDRVKRTGSGSDSREARGTIQVRVLYSNGVQIRDVCSCVCV